MSTSGRGGDALAKAGHYRAHTADKPQRKPVGADYSGLSEVGLLALADRDEAQDHAARLGVCDLAITAGCQRDTDGPCTHPEHPAHVAGVLHAWYALGLAEDPTRPNHLNEWGRRKSRQRDRRKTS